MGPAVTIIDRRRNFDGYDPALDLASVMSVGRRSGPNAGFGGVKILTIKRLGDSFKVVFDLKEPPVLVCNERLLCNLESMNARCKDITGYALLLPANVTDDRGWCEYLLTLLERPEA